MPFALRSLAAAALLTMAFGAAAGKLYRWVDAQGRVHYSDQPALNAHEVDPKAPTAERSEGTSEASTEDPVACQKKKEQLAAYRSATSITETNGLGETHEYNDAQKQKLIDAAEKSIGELCGEN